MFTSKAHRGFTLVEVTVVIVVIAILATIASLGLAKYQRDGRDSIRNSSTVVIGEALEKYYDKNGEYPGCQILSGSSESVAALLGIDQASLTAPGAPDGENSLKCAVEDDDSSDVFRYTGDASLTCTEGVACLFWTIEFTKEENKEIVSLNSRRKVDVQTAGAPLLNGSVESSTSVGLSWTSIVNATQYTIEYSLSSTFSAASIAVAYENEALIDGLAQGKQYYFRVKAGTDTGDTPWSNIRTITTTIDEPDAPTVVASQSGTSAVGTSSQVACAAGTTAQYSQRYRRTASETDGAWSSYTSWGTSRTYTIANASEGYEYTFQAQARCASPVAQSPASASALDTVVIPLTTPGSAVVTATISGATATGTLTAITCPTGSSAQYQMRYRTSIDSANLGSWTSYDTWNSTRTRSVSVNPGYRAGFQGQVRCVSAQDTSDQKTSNEASVVRPFAAAPAPSVSVSISSSTATATAAAITCPAGSSPQYSIRSRHSNDSANYGTWSSYSSWSTTRTRADTVNQGYRRGYQAQARCVGDFNTTAGSAGSEAGAARGIAAPAAPTYTGDVTWNAGYRYRQTYSTSCPSGTTLHSEGVQFWNTGFSGSYRNPSSGFYIAPDNDLWWLGWAAGQVHEDVYYYGRYRCRTDFATSPYSANRSTKVDITCSASRRNYSASPRCDSYGQSWTAQPFGT